MPTRPPTVPDDARWNSRDRRWEHARFDDGRAVGPFRAYREDGTLLLEGGFSGGRLHGELKRFHADGGLARAGTYRSGVLVGTVVVEARPGDGFPWQDERGRRARLTYDEDGDETGRLELDERGREVKPGVVLGTRDGCLDALFAEHGPDRFLTSGAFARAVAAIAPPRAEPCRDDGLLLPYPALPRRAMAAACFEERYGFAMPDELAAWLAACRGSPLLAGVATTPDLEVYGGGNLVEAAILEHQVAPGRTTFWKGLVSGTLPIGNLGEHELVLGLFEQGAAAIPNAVYPLDTTEPGWGAMGGPLARSLDDLAYLLALIAADACGAVSRSALAPAYERLRGRVDLLAELAGFEARALPGGAAGEVEGDPEGDHRRGFAFRRATAMPRAHAVRGCWLGALLCGHAEEAYQLFRPRHDAPWDDPGNAQACLDGVGLWCSTAIYGLLRAWVFQRRELGRLLAVARVSRSQVVRDAAALVAELAAGRNTLGTVEDLASVRAAFVAMKPLEKPTEDDRHGDGEGDDDDGADDEA